MNKTLFTILVIVCGLLTVVLFSNNCHQPVKPVIVPVKEQAKVVAAAEQAINPKIDSLQADIEQSAVTNKKLSETNARLQAENRRLGKIAINHTIDTLPTSKDSAKQAVINVVRNAEQADSVCNLIISELQTTILQQEDIIVLKDSLYNQLKASFNFALDQQTALNNYSNQLKKELRKKQATNFGYKATTAAAVIFIIAKMLK